MSEQVDEWVVYRIYTGYVDYASAGHWDAHMNRLAERKEYTNLTLLARGLTQEQAKAMVRLTTDGEDDE